MFNCLAFLKAAHNFTWSLADSGDRFQGSNLTFEVNSQMASTWSGFTSQECVSTGQVYSTKQSFLFIKQTRENVKLLLLSNCNQFIIQLNIKCIVCGHV